MFYGSILNLQITEIIYQAIFLDCAYVKHRINFFVSSFDRRKIYREKYVL